MQPNQINENYIASTIGKLLQGMFVRSKHAYIVVNEDLETAQPEYNVYEMGYKPVKSFSDAEKAVRAWDRINKQKLMANPCYGCTHGGSIEACNLVPTMQQICMENNKYYEDDQR